MKIHLVHQNFPGQYRHIAQALVSAGHNVSATTMQNLSDNNWRGICLYPYSVSKGTTAGIHPWASDIETKIIRGEACFRACLQLKQLGYEPDVIIGHPGWGETLFIKQVWPEAKLGIYSEFYYASQGSDVGFDPEFSFPDEGDACRIELKNINNLLHFEFADAGMSPTKWQASTFPERFRDKITVCHDGIDTEVCKPNLDAYLSMSGGLKFSRNDEIITFVNRNLEPYRGYHIFMRSLPEILKRRPNAKIMIVGGDDVSYGAKRKDGRKWKDIFIEEVRPQISDADWKRVFFLGNIPYQYFIPLLQISTVHVYLTYPFVLSWSLLEAMSVGCAIVASDTAPLREAIHHDETGRLVDFFDVQGLAHQVCDLLEKPNERARIGANARAFVQKTYDLKTVCLPKQIAWVEDLAAGKFS